MSQSVTSIVYQIDLEKLEALEEHSHDVSRVLRISAEARHESGDDDELYAVLLADGIKEAGLEIDPSVIQAVKSHSYDPDKFGAAKASLVLPPHHAAITLSYELSERLPEINDLGVKISEALKAKGKNELADGMERGAHSSKLASAFLLSADDCDYGENFSCFESVVMNRGQVSEPDNPNTPAPITILYEGGHPTTFAKGVKTDYPYDVAP